MDELFRDEQVVCTTTSPEVAARLIREWLTEVVPRQEGDMPEGRAEKP